MAAIDGSVDRKTETMEAGFVVGTGPQPEDSLSFPVGGPLASLRGWAVGLDCLLDLVESDKPILVFTNCLVLLTILLRWELIDLCPTQTMLGIWISSVRACRSFDEGPGPPAW